MKQSLASRWPSLYPNEKREQLRGWFVPAVIEQLIHEPGWFVEMALAAEGWIDRDYDKVAERQQRQEVGE